MTATKPTILTKDIAVHWPAGPHGDPDKRQQLITKAYRTLWRAHEADGYMPIRESFKVTWDTAYVGVASLQGKRAD